MGHPSPLTKPSRPALVAETQALTKQASKALQVELVFVSRSSQWSYQLQHLLKRLADIVLSASALLLISPLLLLLAVLVKFSSPGPVIYKSLRIGKNSKPFSMYKFRTMYMNADTLRDQLRATAKLDGELFKLENDPRVSPLGHLLRSFSLDELPQLFNVLKGDMSLVGPRPLPPDESAYFEEPYTLRFQVTPGITGLWQISGRSQLNFKQLSELEMSYVLRWSIFEDLRILLRTVPAVLLRRGAC